MFRNALYFEIRRNQFHISIAQEDTNIDIKVILN